jgi:predicted acetyltransferase
VDESLPFLLTNPRQMRTTDLNDGIWVNVRDVTTSFGARHYATTDRLVVEVDGERYAIEGGADGGSCTRVRTRPDLVATRAALGALLLGGTTATALVRGGRLTARNADAQRRADVFFTTAVAPHCQTMY